MNVQEHVRERAEALGAVTGLPVQVLDENGRAELRCGGMCEYCRIFARFLKPGESCENLHALAGRRAMDLGESYIFTCHAGVYHIVMPLVSGSEFIGAVLLGPFMLGAADSTLIQEVARRCQLPTDALLDMYDAAGSLRTLTAEEAGALCRMVRYLFGTLEDQTLEARRGRAQQQSRIFESIQTYKGFQAAGAKYPLEKERALVRHVRSGNAAEAKALLNDLLGYALFSTGGSLEGVKALTAELCALLSRAAIEGGVETMDALAMNRLFMRSLWQASTVEDLCYHMQEAVERFCLSAFPPASTVERDVIRQATRFINIHFAEALTLQDAARSVHLSESYFSSLFKKGSGSSFREYLNAVRVDEAKKLLDQNRQSVTEVALAVGFESQSYFSKVFRAVTGMSPKEYRIKVHVNHTESGAGA
jgi:AraC-like DNA-binding protein/ligand-binding sensor protein